MKIYKDVVNDFQENFYLYFDEEEGRGVLIDPGARSEILENFIKKNNLKIQAILLTHGHIDHIAAADYYRDLYQVPILAPWAEKDLLESADLNNSRVFTGRASGLEADEFFDPGDRVTDFEIEVIGTPGHTSGSVTFKHDKFLFTGDCLFAGSVGRWDLPTGDLQQTKESVTMLLDMEGDAVIYPGHGPMTNRAREREFNAFYQAVKAGREIY